MLNLNPNLLWGILPLILPAAVADYTFPDCSSAPLSSLPLCDPSLPPLTRARSLIASLTPSEKVSITRFDSPGVPRINLPAYNWWNEALHGVADSPGVLFTDSGPFSHATSFPAPITLGAAFNDTLVHAVASIISTEARAFANTGHAGLDYWTPNINPFRDPRWGRGQETPGEDPLHLSRYVYQLIDGLQGGIDPERPKVLATCKHLAAYDLESWEGVERYAFDARVSTQDLAEYYLPSFRACVRDAKVGAVMCSYNALNGVPTCADSYLLQTVLREHWGWEADGHWVTSDCGALENVWKDHKYVGDEAHAAAAAINAGVDVDCGSTFPDGLAEAMELGLVANGTLDRALTRLYTSLVQLGYFDEAEGQVWRGIGWESVNSPEARGLAYAAATEGTVLLKNRGVLPLKLKGNGTVAVIGPYGNVTEEMQSNYAGPAEYIPTVVEGAQMLGYKVLYAQGTEMDSDATDGFEEALSVAGQADVVIYCGGIDNSIEAEGRDRTSIAWPGNQLDLIAQLADVGKPLTVVQFGGGQVDDSELLANDNVGAIVWVGYPGQAGGLAVMDILTGNAAPAGRLPITQYPASYAEDVPMTDMALRPGGDSPGRTYRWYEDAVLPFGFGLHYTTFNVSWAKKQFGPYKSAQLTHTDKGAFADLATVDTFELLVKNTGGVASDYVALVFVSAPDVGPQPAPIKTLVGYSRASLIKPGETRKVDIEVAVGALARTGIDGSSVLYPGQYTLLVDVEQDYPTASFEIGGQPVVVEKFPQPPSNQTVSRGEL